MTVTSPPTRNIGIITSDISYLLDLREVQLDETLYKYFFNSIINIQHRTIQISKFDIKLGQCHLRLEYEQTRY